MCVCVRSVCEECMGCVCVCVCVAGVCVCVCVQVCLAQVA